ncbi:hypothetical protein [Lactococcus cremoris]|uniref:hypothetical protein n=1 Tax=Lactococcus lactis subsp. cremoris TaxID=1359 RepID=UPI0003ABB911|nr:hypothetical protein [Lactococcus cremoris]AGV73763.1 phage-related protein [Lactococcus cremoris subsp. cremoris KW2]
MVLNITLCIIAVSVLLLALSINEKASKTEILKLKSEIKSLNSNNELLELRNKVYKLEIEIYHLYKYKVIYKDSYFLGPKGIVEKYFFDEKSAKKFMEKENICSEVLINLNEDGEN